MTIDVIRLAIGLVPVTVLAQWFFGFNLWGLGFGLVAFFLNLVLTSWAIEPSSSSPGSCCARHGVEGLAWSILFFFLPFACVYYPVSSPAGMAADVRLVPAADLCVRGLMAAIVTHEFRADLMAEALAINAGLLAAGAATFLALLQSARKAGSLLQMGE